MATLFDDSGNAYTDEMGYAAESNAYIARKFTPTTAGWLTTVSVWLKAKAEPYDPSIHMQIRNDDDPYPSDDVIETSSTIVDHITADFIKYDFTFTGTNHLDLATPYWIVLYRTDSDTQRTVYIDGRPGGTPGRYDHDGLQPWSYFSGTLDITVLGNIASPGAHAFGVMII